MTGGLRHDSTAAVHDAARSELDDWHAKWFREVPVHLVEKVNGSPERKSFVHIGDHITETLAAELDVLSRAERVLDFGCGLSRVLWPMMRRFPVASFTGFDVDPMMLANSKKMEVVSDCRFVHSTRKIPDGSMDAIYIISVFTHLHATVEFWLSEVHRMLSDRGQAFITYHDETLYGDLRERGQVARSAPPRVEDRLVIGQGAEGSTGLAVFYTTPAWEDTLTRYFDVETTQPRGLHGHQSFSVVRKRDVRYDRAEVYREYMTSLEEELFRLRESKRLPF